MKKVLKRVLKWGLVAFAAVIVFFGVAFYIAYPERIPVGCTYKLDPVEDDSPLSVHFYRDNTVDVMMNGKLADKYRIEYEFGGRVANFYHVTDHSKDFTTNYLCSRGGNFVYMDNFGGVHIPVSFRIVDFDDA